MNVTKWSQSITKIAGLALLSVCGFSSQVAANQVRVALEGELLVVSGDNAANQITISTDAVGNVIVLGRGGTRVNGRPSVTFQLPTINAVEIKMNGGHDSVILDNMQIRNDFYSDLGAGNDSLLSGSQPSSVGANGDVVVEVENVAANSSYFLQVQSLPGNELAGNYLLVVDITTREPNMELIQNVPLSSANSDQFGEFTTFKTQLFRFDLTMSPGDANQGCQLSIYSDSGRVESVTSVSSGQTRTIYVWLNAGDHIFRFTAKSRFNQPILNSIVDLKGASVSDDEGPILLDPSGNPISGPQITGNNPPPPPRWSYPRFHTGLMVPIETPW